MVRGIWFLISCWIFCEKTILLHKHPVFRHVLFVSLSSKLSKNTRSKERVFFYPLRKQWHIINDSVAIVVSYQSVRTVYHHALACIKNLSQWWYTTSNKVDDMQFLAELMIYNDYAVDLFPLLCYNTLRAVILWKYCLKIVMLEIKS